MSFDFSRMSFDPLKDYLGVVMQQGRVQLDADWNELVAQFQRRVQTGDLDTFSDTVVPRVTPDGFLITLADDSFNIGPGRIYVDGILAENHAEVPLEWNQALAELSGTGSVDYDQQLYYPLPESLPDGDYLVYLDVWHRDMTFLQDPELIEKAVGVDSTGRRQTIWQVKFLANIEGATPNTEARDIPGWLELIQPSSGRLTTSTGDLPDQDDPCLLPPEAGYKGLENQLYRLEIHQGGGVGDATFKWSRDNAAVASRVTAIPQLNVLVVESTGRDNVLRFNNGDWVEVTDDHRILHGIPGELRRIQLGDGVDDATRTITLEQDLSNGLFPVNGQGETDPERNTIIKRWDQVSMVRNEDGSDYYDLNANPGDIPVPAVGIRVFLEHGILVEFDLAPTGQNFTGEFKSGDYWLITARSVDASIDILESSPPQDIHHHYAKLALIIDDSVNDCRTLWPPLIQGEGCDCTVCVLPEAHNTGAATIQQAIDTVISNGGGTVCLGSGRYEINTTLQVHNGTSVKIRGQGWSTILFSDEPNIVMDIQTGSDISLENFTVIAAAEGGTASPVVDVQNVLGFKVDQCNLFNFAAGDATSAGMRFSGYAFLSKISNCLIFAEQGFIGASRERESFLTTLNFAIENCAIFASQRGISFEDISYHGFKTSIRSNLIIGSEQAGMVFNGAQVINSDFDITDNLLTDCQIGIRTGISNCRINGNDFWGVLTDDSAGDAISIEAGLDPAKLENLQIIGNRINNFSGHGIVIREDVGKMMIKQNQINDIIGAGFFVESGSIEYLALENNQFSRVSGRFSLPDGSSQAMVAIFLQAVQRADISHNLLDTVVDSDINTAIRAAIAVVASGDIQINGNRMFSVGPDSFAGFALGIFANSIGSRLDVNHNNISRGNGEVNLGIASWIPVFGATGLSANTGFVAGTAASATTASVAATTFASSVVITNNNESLVLNARSIRVFATVVNTAGSASIQHNRLLGDASNQSVAIVQSTQSCVFSHNECINSVNQQALVLLEADHIDASHNRLIGVGDLDVMLLQSKKTVVIGNMSSGNIRISGGNLPAPWDQLNIIV